MQGWQPPGSGGHGGDHRGGGHGGDHRGGGGHGPTQGPPGYGAPPSAQGYGPVGAYGTPSLTSASGYGGYEFSEQENAVIAKTAGRAKLWGIISIATGALSTVSSCGAFANPTFLLNLPTGIVGIIVGIVFLGVGNALQGVVMTRGNDVAHIMQALEKMGSAFLVQIIATIVNVVLTIVVFVFLMFVLAVISLSSH